MDSRAKNQFMRFMNRYAVKFNSCSHHDISRVRLPLLELRTGYPRIQGGYARIYLKIIILKHYMHRARAALSRALAPRAKVGGMSQP